MKKKLKKTPQKQNKGKQAKQPKEKTEKLINVIALSLSVAFFMIGVHLTMTQGIQSSYFVFMISVALLFYYQLKKRKDNESSQT
ncbi:hypothetical protein [Aureibacter tunicatorum]|uniref:Flp pilus assembly protein TadB n=1 Tax=Aureibacter tunicatorum TaxID=866807 RepID=A0AAE3XIM1_9BACT|nr:hypothetical protein [Aureibacter tunicatorum]MDR6237393.1 Flp pilus assembly protein TadB [Aureibacter tunicatorum]BDD06383.1 hypothetical protein AUTU_38660 [Aureibacter tunicatorum]